MTQITIRISGASAESHRTGPLTAGMVGVPVQFIFGPEWDDITAITAVFEAGDLARDRELIKDSGGLFQTTVPHEVLAKPNTTLMIGVEGRKSDGSIIIPTTWSRVGTILRGATSTGAPSLAPTPTQYDRILQKIGNLDELETEGKDSIVDAVNELNENIVVIAGIGENSVVLNGGEPEQASGDNSLASGKETQAAGYCAHAEGRETNAAGYCAHAEGLRTETNANCAHAEGFRTKVSGANAHAEGSQTIAASENQHVQGKFNIEDTANKFAHIVGNGTGDTKRSNAHAIDWKGNGWFAGKVTAGADPTEDMDLVTMKYLKTILGSYINDIDTLIGGDS